MTTNNDINQLGITEAEAKQALALLEQAIALLRLKPIAQSDKARMARIEDAALPAYEAIAALAERRPDIIPAGICAPTRMREDLGDAGYLRQVITTTQRLLELAQDNRAAAISDIVREGNAGYAIAARVDDPDIRAAVEPLGDVFKSRRNRR
jgi:hypothetical protein